MESTSGRMTALELKALVAALSSDKDPKVRELFYIIPNLHVAARKYTGFGFFTKFSPNESLKRSNLDEDRLSKDPPSAIGFHPEIEGFADFLIWVKNDQIDCLEAASTSELAHRRISVRRIPIYQKVPPNYSVKWTAAVGRGIFIRIVAAATYLKR